MSAKFAFPNAAALKASMNVELMSKMRAIEAKAFACKTQSDIGRSLSGLAAICGICHKKIDPGEPTTESHGELFHYFCYQAAQNKVNEYVYGKDWREKCPLCHCNKTGGKICDSCIKSSCLSAQKFLE